MTTRHWLSNARRPRSVQGRCGSQAASQFGAPQLNHALHLEKTRRGRTWLAALQVHPRWGPGARASSLDPPRQVICGPASLLFAGSRDCTPAGVLACGAGPCSKRCPCWETLAVALGLRGSLCRRIRVAISGKHLVITLAAVMIRSTRTFFHVPT